MPAKRIGFWIVGILALVPTARAGGSPEDSVVRVFASIRYPNPIRPWAKQNLVEVMGTGVVIDGSRILTNAQHIVFYASEVFIQDRKGANGSMPMSPRSAPGSTWRHSPSRTTHSSTIGRRLARLSPSSRQRIPRSRFWDIPWAGPDWPVSRGVILTNQLQCLQWTDRGPPDSVVDTQPSPWEQRRAGDGRRQDGRPWFSLEEPRTRGTSSRTRRSTPISKTSRTGSLSRQVSIHRSVPEAGQRGAQKKKLGGKSAARTAASCFASPVETTRRTRFANGTS